MLEPRGHGPHLGPGLSRGGLPAGCRTCPTPGSEPGTYLPAGVLIGWHREKGENRLVGSSGTKGKKPGPAARRGSVLSTENHANISRSRRGRLFHPGLTGAHEAPVRPVLPPGLGEMNGHWPWHGQDLLQPSSWG